MSSIVSTLYAVFPMFVKEETSAFVLLDVEDPTTITISTFSDILIIASCLFVVA